MTYNHACCSNLDLLADTLRVNVTFALEEDDRIMNVQVNQSPLPYFRLCVCVCMCIHKDVPAWLSFYVCAYAYIHSYIHEDYR
jgi:hypothetical protein